VHLCPHFAHMTSFVHIALADAGSFLSLKQRPWSCLPPMDSDTSSGSSSADQIEALARVAAVKEREARTAALHTARANIGRLWNLVDLSDSAFEDARKVETLASTLGVAVAVAVAVLLAPLVGVP
jgi:hypothetical protein